jgi:hypothetical protein
MVRCARDLSEKRLINARNPETADELIKSSKELLEVVTNLERAVELENEALVSCIP